MICNIKTCKVVVSNTSNRQSRNFNQMAHTSLIRNFKGKVEDFGMVLRDQVQTEISKLAVHEIQRESETLRTTVVS